MSDKLPAELSGGASEEDKLERPKCWPFFTEWRRCTGPSNQFRNYYIYGEVETCKEQYDDLMFCFSLKFDRREVAKVTETLQPST